MSLNTDSLFTDLSAAPHPVRFSGLISSVTEHVAEVSGLAAFGSVGAAVTVSNRSGGQVPGEIVGFRGDQALVMGFRPFAAVGPGCSVRLEPAANFVRPSVGWLSRVINGAGDPIDGGAPLTYGDKAYPLRAAPPSAFSRGLVDQPLDLGIAALNTFVTACQGQRLGIFAGSGVGKTTLMGMLSKLTDAEANVIVLVGERGRELAEFLNRHLDGEQRSRTLVVVSTSDESAILRRRAVLLAVTAAEYLRDQGMQVMMLMDSATRYAMALREIGLANGEPPGAGGYPPSVIAELPRMIERLGPVEGSGAITAFLTVLVDGDDMNDPVADAMRGFLDGHIVLDRRVAERGRYPPIDVVRSVSRAMPHCNRPEDASASAQALKLESVYLDIEDLYKLSLYKLGTDPEIDRAIAFHGKLEQFLSQAPGERRTLDEGFNTLRAALAEVGL